MKNLGPIAALGCTFAVSILLFKGILVDDAFIVFRLAENARLGYGFAWNPGGEPVEGMTSILWAMLLIPFAADRESVYASARVLGVLSLAGALVLFVKTTFRTVEPGAHRVAIWMLVAVSPLLTFHAMNGLETGLAVFAVMAMLWSSLRVLRTDRKLPDRVFRAACVFGSAWLLGGASRPELVVYGLLLSFFIIVELHPARRLAFLRAISVVFLGPGLVYFLARWTYFGLPLPLSFYVKQAPGIGSAYGVKYVGLSLVGLIGGVVLLGLLRSTEVFRNSFENGAYRVIFWPPLMMCTSYVFFVPIMGFVYRFTVPFVLPLILVASESIAGSIRARDSRISTGAVKLGIALVALIQLVGSVLPAHHFAVVNSRATSAFHVKFGRLLADISPDGKLVAFNEVGAPSFFSGWRSVESAGVVTRYVARYPELTRQEIVEQFDPDVIIMTASESRLETVASAFPRFQRVHSVPWLVYRGGPRHYQVVFAREGWTGLVALERGVQDLGLGEIDPPWYFPFYRLAKRVFV